MAAIRRYAGYVSDGYFAVVGIVQRHPHLTIWSAVGAIVLVVARAVR